MHDHILGVVGQPRGTPPQSPRPERAEGDVTRSDSYSLTRGGKLVSSRPWATNGVDAYVNMRAAETQKNLTDSQHPRRASPSSETSSDSESDSDSGDSEETSEDEYDTGGRRSLQRYLPGTIPEEEHEAPHLDTACPSEGSSQASGTCSARDRSSDDSHLLPRVGRGVGKSETEDTAERGKENTVRNTSDDCNLDEDDGDEDDDSDDEEEEEDSESEETESTVRAKPDGASAYTDGNNKPSPVREEEDHNDTLSTLSGDLSFDDPETSPPRDPERAGGSGSASESRRPPSPVSLSGAASPASGRLGVSATEEHVGGQATPDGERRTPQREGMRAGVFCISGYPRPSHKNIQTTNEAPLTGDRPYSIQPHHDSSYFEGEEVEDVGRGTEHSSGRRDSMHSDYSWDNLSSVSDPDGSVQRPPLPYTNTATYGMPPRNAWPSHSRKEAPPTARGTDASGSSTESHYENVEGYLHRENPRGRSSTEHARESSLGPGVFTSAPHHDAPRISFIEQHRKQPDQHLDSEARRQYSSSPQPRLLPKVQQDGRRPHSSVYDNTSSTREGVRGGSPARPRPAASASPMPRLLLSAAGLSGSASRLSGGAAGAGLSTTRLAASYTALGSSASSGYGSCAGVAVASSTRHEDSEDLSDVSSGAASEDSARRRRRRSTQSMKGEASVSGNEDFEWVRGSPMLTGLREGQVTRLATPPDHRTHSLRSSLATPTEAVEEACAALTPRHRQYPRPPPVPRPRTLEAGELVPHRSIRDLLRDSIRDSRDSLRDRLYSPSRELTGHRLSRDSSVERSGRDSSCDRASVSSLHQHSHHHHHHVTPSRLSQHPCCDPPSCWCEEEELDYESCDERHHHHRHSYHEGLHRAHLHQLQPHHHHHRRRGSREASREQRSRGQGTADSGRSSPCCCRHCRQSGSHSSLASHDYCANNRLALPCTNKVGGGLVTPQGSRQHRRLDSDYIALWSCHSPPGGSLEDRVMRLEGDKDSLQLQVTVLSEQVEAQAEKITDLENLLEDKKEQLQKAEEQLQKEMMIRTSLETQRLELVSELSNMKLHQAAYERENSELREKIRQSDHHSDHSKPVPSGASLGRYGSGRGAAPAAASTPVHSFVVTPDSPQANHQLAAPLTNSPSPSSISTLSTIPASSPNKSPAQPATASPASSPVASHDAREFLSPRTPPPNARRKIDQFGTVPRQREAGVGGENNQTAANAGRTKGVMFGKGFHFIPFRVTGKRSTSAPNLAETEMQMIEDLPEGEYEHHDGVTSPASSSPRGSTLAGHRSPPTHPKATGIKKIFTKLRRSSSGHLDGELGEGDFRRGGMRATASARLGWTSPSPSFKEPSEPFDKWGPETVENWLGVLGLSQYCSSLRSWTLSGHRLSQATPQNLERELGIRHPLHRKKLQLAISARMSGDQINTPLHRLDHSWVLRWLDDVGLPQYKDAFSEARIDGRVLNCLTYDDLSFLRLSNLLHVTSLKRGIQVLREHNFDPSVLKRRSVPDEDPRARTAAQVALWTNHRVMEWLRTVDLSEYAPNLRGSGVHGALMVYEVRFTSELLASLLSIPSGKTLLRRHLNTHFKELVGRSVVQEKRELEASSGYTPLTTSAKVKMPKKSQFSLKRKKSKSELEFDDLLCPLDEKPPLGALQDREKETNGDGRLC